jgi:hypothetical protein
MSENIYFYDITLRSWLLDTIMNKSQKFRLEQIVENEGEEPP